MKDRSAPHSEGASGCPRSAVSHGVGLVGLIGLVGWTLIAWHFGMDGPHAGIAAVVACGVPMIAWSLLVDKVHRNPTTGINWTGSPRPLRETVDISIVKLAGLWATWGGIALFYGLARWYSDGGYVYAMKLLTGAAPVLFVLSVPYIVWIDRRLVEPRDDCFAFGQWVIGGAAGQPEAGKIADHLRSWAVKAFFLAFMLSVVPDNFASVIRWQPADILSGPVPLASFLIASLFLIDVAFATVGYMLTLRPLDAHIRSANPLTAGWAAALICYPPFVLMGSGGPLDYHRGTADWSVWLADHPLLLAIWGGLLVLLTGIYAWATVAFGLRFSNLTHRGIITHGPYRWTRHPAYLAKNLFWWLSVIPVLTTTGHWTDAVRNCALLALTSAVYYWRARTEEAHLSADPAYRDYSAWMDRHAPIPRLIARIRGARAAGSVPLSPHVPTSGR
ncbi:methyltransferase family protein [Sphingobium subterraneum]|uniref:Protein-S-isoprenylcysteine O-methyltransferase Ste14 n=1 Tax=Sphingobium subterraneum TaxID=627688 RepID=A0A841J6H5_9SPHN|nr:isoprenylcysteine carboxylmethyltransferase family protein [Sphingobium subterraneum]MBB6124148.1 protein-S-isoprenylcysteine O-methyltransferase Ste14 [Sphingobium subterraneum]